MLKSFLESMRILKKSQNQLTLAEVISRLPSSSRNHNLVLHCYGWSCSLRHCYCCCCSLHHYPPAPPLLLVSAEESNPLYRSRRWSIGIIFNPIKLRCQKYYDTLVDIYVGGSFFFAFFIHTGPTYMWEYIVQDIKNFLTIWLNSFQSAPYHSTPVLNYYYY